MMETGSGPVKKKKTNILIVLLCAAAAVTAAVAVVLSAAGTLGGRPAFVADDNAVEGSVLMQGKNIEDRLQEAADASMFSFRINSQMSFAGGEEEGIMIIESPAHNHYDMQVRIVLDDTGETVYETGVIQPGKSIARDTLDTPLKKGEYAATAIITALDPETGEEAGKNAAAIMITVES